MGADLHRAVQAALASKRLGTPVFVRYLFHYQGAAAVVLTRLTLTVMTLRDWFGQPLERIAAAGTVKDRHLTLTLEWRGGGTALVSWAGTTAPGPGIDLTVLGNHGAIYHDLGMANGFDLPEPAAPQPAPDEELQAWIEQAIRSGRPENAPKGDRP